MGALDRTLESLRGRAPAEVLEELAWLRQRVAAGERLVEPRVTVVLRSGREFTGFLLELKRESRANTLVLQLPGPDPRVRLDDVAFVPLESIDVVLAHDLPCIDRAPTGSPEPPGRLEVKRRLGELRSRAATLLGAEIAAEADWGRFEEGEPLRGLDEAIAQVGRILEELAAEALGLEALKAHVRVIRFEGADRTGARREEQTLCVGVGDTPRRRALEAGLKKEIEAAL